MTDFHTHILPGMDDGARDADHSIRMIRTEIEQGVRGIALTPHMYPNTESLKNFMNRRNEAVNILRDAVYREFAGERITFYPGAEVYYFDGIENADEIYMLRIAGTGLLLVEMPFSEWPRHVVDAVLKLSQSRDFRVVIAHIERYAGFQRDGVISELLNNGIYFQSNAAWFIDRRARKNALEMLSKGKIHFLGSDAHNTSSRPPEMGRAIEIIRKNLGEEPLKRLHDTELRYNLK